MIEDCFFESTAHYASGMAAMSFCMWAVMLYKWRRRNRMTFLLFLSVAYIAISFLKDAIFLLPMQIFSDEYFVEDLVSIFDLMFIPITSAFFIEATRPGTVTNRRLAASCLPFAALFLLYGVLRASWVLTATFAISALVGIFTLVAVPINVVRYNKYLSDNYSYTKNIGVGWCLGCSIGLFLLLLFYEVCFYRPTWFTETLYDTCFVVIWNIMCLKNSKHRVVADMMAFKGSANEEDEASEPEDEEETATPMQTEESAAPISTDAAALPSADDDSSISADDGSLIYDADGSQPDTASSAPLPADDVQTEPAAPAKNRTKDKDKEQDKEQKWIAAIASELERCMETDKIYLNSRLTLNDLATAVGTNKTYISKYINSQGSTFYDFINKYRIDEACRLIDQMATGDRLTMADVATLSGFNSVSSFNRYFSKVKGITPTTYLRDSQE